MTTISPIDLDADPANLPEGLVGYLSGRWIPQRSMCIAVDDAGFRFGVTAVERLRTYGTRIFEIDAHLARWNATNAQLGIDSLPGPGETGSLMRMLVAKNAVWVQQQRDVGITLFATPGPVGGGGPTFGLHLNQLNHARINRRRRSGQPVVVTSVMQPDPQSWPRWIKTRCRLHYYRADQIARRQDDDAIGVLIDRDGSVTETSIANLAMVRGAQIVSPPQDRVLAGITQSVVQRLAAEAAIPWVKQPIEPQELAAADEILMMGTDGGLWFANSINGRSLTDSAMPMIYGRLRTRFDNLVRGNSADEQNGSGRDATSI